MKKTAVEFLADNLDLKLDFFESKKLIKLFEQAKEMEKQQIEDAWYIGVKNEGEEHGHTFLYKRKDLAEKYYNETFKTKEQ